MENAPLHIFPQQLQIRIAEEERKYHEALKNDLPFERLKEIKDKIKMLKVEYLQDGQKKDSDARH